MVAQHEVNKWEELTPSEFVAAVRERPVAFVPLGLLEWHGEHLPLGTDMLKIYYPHLVHMERLSPGVCLIQRYGDEWVSYPRDEQPDWVWREDVRETSPAARGVEMIQRIADRVAGLVTAALAEVEAGARGGAA
ncbi:MAG: creatininase family protein [Anaerolineae bacterium]|nr:creatininase family protein [Anaerolineae bacterium]